MTVGLTTSPRRIARSSVARRKPVSRDQSPTYGDGGHCACIPRAARSPRAGRAGGAAGAAAARASRDSAPSASGPPAHAAYATADGRPRPHGSEPDRASSTSATSAPRSSTGCSRATTSGEFRLRIENTDTSREVAEAVDQIQDSLRWLGLDWDGPRTFQLDRMDDCRRVADELVAEGKAYEDEGAIRFRMPDDGSTAWDDIVRGRVEFPNETLEDLVLVRSDGRPTYNFASPMEDVWDGITHVIRGEDHISNTPKQINIIRAVGAELARLRARAERERRRRQEALEAPRRDRRRRVPQATATSPRRCELPRAARLGARRRDDDHEPDELIERFTLERVSPSPAQFDYAKLDWMNGVYLRELAAGGVRAPARPLARREGLRLGRRARLAGGAARAGEDREAGGVPGLRAASSSTTWSRTRPTSTAARRCSRRRGGARLARAVRRGRDRVGAAGDG